MELWLRRKGLILEPADMPSEAAMMKLPFSVDLRGNVVQPRNGPHHRLVWKLWSLIAMALNDGPSQKEWEAEDVCLHCKVAVGLTRPIKVKGRTIEVPASISYDAMDEIEFSTFSKNVMRYVSTELCPWIEASPHWREIERILYFYAPGEAA